MRDLLVGDGKAVDIFNSGRNIPLAHGFHRIAITGVTGFLRICAVLGISRMIFQFSFKSGFKNGSKNFLQGSLNLFYRLWSVRIVDSLTNFFLYGLGYASP